MNAKAMFSLIFVTAICVGIGLGVGNRQCKHTIKRSKNIPYGITNKGQLEYVNYLRVVTEVLLL